MPLASRRAPGRLAPAFAVLLSVAACAGTPSGSDGPVTDAGWTFAADLPVSADYEAPSQDGVWVREVEAIGPDGIPDRETALRLFALAVGPVPGVEVDAERRVIRSASLALRAVRAHWEELSDAQRAAIDRALDLPAETVSIQIPEVGDETSSRPMVMAGLVPPLGLSEPAAPAAEQNHPYTEEVIRALREASIWVRAAITARMDGEDIPGPIEIDLAPCEIQNPDPEVPGGKALGCAEGVYGDQSPGTKWGSGPYQGCRVRVSGVALAGGAAVVVNTLAHEIFHCFQFHGYETTAAFARAPSWVIEGGAEWVGNDVTGDLAETDYLYNPWFLAPQTSLFGRSYSAVGFWSHLDESGKSPYDVFRFVWLTVGSPAAFRGTAAADTPTFLDSWASSLTRLDAFGRAWDTEGAGIPGRDVQAVPETWDVANGSTVEMHTAPYTARVFRLQVSADVLRIGGSGHARISDGAVDTVAFPASFCTKPGGCEPCPGSEQVPPAPLGQDPYFVLTGGVDGSTFTVAGESMDVDCPTPSPSPPSPSPDDDEDEFCRRYEALIDWTVRNSASELTQPWAAEIARQTREMRPFAPDRLVSHVDLFHRVYDRYATKPEPANVPYVGPDAVGLPDAIRAMHGYCGIPFG
jgi:hypothetical protein